MKQYASSYQLMDCGDPNCGPHIVLIDDDDEVFAELVMSLDSAGEFARELQQLLYEKAVQRS